MTRLTLALLLVTAIPVWAQQGPQDLHPFFSPDGGWTQVLNRIHEDRDPTFFVSSKSNPSSTAFFQKQRHLSLVDETERYRVYSLLHSGA
jgi:hypothetical protein